MKPNAAGLIVAGAANPNWKGGPWNKICEICASPYQVKRVHSSSRYCSLKCVGVSQRGKAGPVKEKVSLQCEVCDTPYSVMPSRVGRIFCCSEACTTERRSRTRSGDKNPNWTGGLSRLPYPYDFTRKTSKEIQARDGFKCQGPECRGKDQRMTAHHIDYDKKNCSGSNLITLCSSCNTLANYNRPRWQKIYSDIMAEREYEQF